MWEWKFKRTFFQKCNLFRWKHKHKHKLGCCSNKKVFIETKCVRKKLASSGEKNIFGFRAYIGIVCGADGIAVTSNSRDSRFESSHGQILYVLQPYWKYENKKRGPFFKNMRIFQYLILGSINYWSGWHATAKNL